MASRALTKRNALAAVIAGLFPCTGFGAVEYTVTDLGVLGGGRYSLGLGINDLGEVTGLAMGADHVYHSAILGQANQLPQSLGLLLGGSYSQGQDINNFHQITGLAYRQGDAGYHAFIWDSAAGARDLGTLEASPSAGSSQGLSINDQGQVAGMSSVNNGTAQHAVVWTPAGGNWTIEDLGTLAADGGGDSRASAINGSGAAAGFATLPGTRALRAVIWRKAAGQWVARDLGSLGGTYGAVAAINDSGLVAGSSSTALDEQVHAFVADASRTPVVLHDLNTLGGSHSEATAINAAGEVVGYSSGAGDISQSAFVWRNAATGMQDLNTLIEQPALPVVGWTLLEAHAISDAGHITGVGLLNGEKHAYLLTRVITDKTPPVIHATWTPAAADGAGGWYITAPSLAWSVRDPDSAISSSTGCAATPAVADTVSQTFSCSATSAGGTASVSTSVKVDTVKPVLVVPPAITQAAANAAGAAVNYAVSASDATSQLDTTTNPSGVTCSAGSGSTFPLGATTVSCFANDNAGNTTTASFLVTVADTAPPAIVCPAPVSVVQGQAIALGVASATDNIGVIRVTHNAPATFPIGATTVTWTAADAAGNLANCGQAVNVASPPPPPPTSTEVLAVTRSQCKRINATSGEWLVQGTSSVVSNNRIQLFATANLLGTSVPVSARGDWQFQAKPGPVCVTPISVKSSATGKTMSNVSVSLQ